MKIITVSELRFIDKERLLDGIAMLTRYDRPQALIVPVDARDLDAAIVEAAAKLRAELERHDEK